MTATRTAMWTAVVLAGAFALALETPILGQAPPGAEEDKAKDPVCKMMVRKNPEISTEYQGVTYYFCMKKDLEAFNQDPEKYLRGGRHTHPDPADSAPPPERAPQARVSSTVPG